MGALLISALATSAVDSLNPIAITQQFVLQGLVKKPRHIWFFILPTGIVNMIFGLLVYYGFAAILNNFWGGLIARHGRIIFTAELVLGALFLAGAVYIAVKIKRAKPKSEESKPARRIKSVTPPALVAIGIVSTLSELTSALPYFAFLAILSGYNLMLGQIILILILYNIVYMLPFMILYLIYIKAKDSFDRLYSAFARFLSKASDILKPAVIGVIGGFLVYHSIVSL